MPALRDERTKVPDSRSPALPIKESSLPEVSAPQAPRSREEIRATIQQKAVVPPQANSSTISDVSIAASLEALAQQQEAFNRKVLTPAQSLKTGAERNLASSERQLAECGVTAYITGLTSASEEAVAVDRKDLVNKTAHAEKLKKVYESSLETKRAAEEMLLTAKRAEAQGFTHEAAAMRKGATDLLRQASEALKGQKSLDTKQAAETLAGLQKLNQKLETAVNRAEWGETIAGGVKETAHTVGVGVGFALGGPGGGAAVNQGLRMVEGAAEESMRVALGEKSWKEAGASVLERSQDALVESAITGVSGAAGQKIGAVVQKFKGQTLAKVVDIVSSGTVQSAGTGVQIGYEYAKAHNEFQKEHAKLAGPERDGAYAKFMTERGFSLEEVSKKLGISFVAGAGAKGAFHSIENLVSTGALQRAKGVVADRVEDLTNNGVEIAGSGQPITAQTIIPALLGGHLTQKAVAHAGPHSGVVRGNAAPTSHQDSSSSAVPLVETATRDIATVSQPKTAAVSEAMSAPPLMRAVPEVVPSKATRPVIDYSLPYSAERIMKDPQITNKNAVILVQHEGRLLYGLRREGLDAAGTWSVISGAMEAHDAHPIDAALRELSEETAYSGQFKSIKVIGGIVDPQNPTSAAIYVVADAHEAFVPSPDAETPEHVEWRWAPAADCPLPAHPKMQQTQELFFESLPAEHLVPADGRLSAIHGTASWFPQFSLNKVVNGSLHGAGVYCGLMHTQGPDYAERAHGSQTPLHGKYVYKLDVSTNIHNGGYESVQRAAPDGFLDRTVDLLRALQKPECQQLADKITRERSGAHGLTAEKVAGLYAHVAGVSYGEARATLGIQGKWVPGFCYVAFNPADVSIVERITLAPPASPKVLLAHSEAEMKQSFENSLSNLRDLRAALSWATKGELGDHRGIIAEGIRDEAHAERLAETMRNTYRSAVLEAARRKGLDKREAQYVALHEREINDIRSALGSEVTQRMWAEQFPHKMPGKIARLLIDHPEVAHDPEIFVRRAAEVAQPDGHEHWNHTRDSQWFASHHQELLQTIWRELSWSSNVHPQPTTVFSERALKARKDRSVLEGILQPTVSGVRPEIVFRQAIDIVKDASSKVNKNRSLSESIIDKALNGTESYHRMPAQYRLALQIAESLKPGTVLTDLPPVPSFLPQGGTVGRLFAKQQINRWLRGHDITTSDISAAAPTVNKMLRSRCEELAQEHDRALEAKTEAESHYDEFVDSTRRLKQRGEEFIMQASERAAEFQAAAWAVGIDAPICRVAAAEITLPCGLSLADAGRLADNWASGTKTSRLNDENKLENALSYFGWRSPTERALTFAHDMRIMDRSDLHPSWTGELLEGLNMESTIHFLDEGAVREARRFVGRD